MGLGIAAALLTFSSMDASAYTSDQLLPYWTALTSNAGAYVPTINYYTDPNGAYIRVYHHKNIYGTASYPKSASAVTGGNTGGYLTH